MGDTLVSLSITQNGFNQSTWEEVDLESLSDTELEVLAELTGVDSEWLVTIARDDRKPCSQCGNPLPFLEEPLCQRCRRGDTIDTEQQLPTSNSSEPTDE